MEGKVGSVKGLSQTNNDSEIITLEECKDYCQKYHLSDERLIEIRNNLIGIVDGVLNAYLDKF